MAVEDMEMAEYPSNPGVRQHRFLVADPDQMKPTR